MNASQSHSPRVTEFSALSSATEKLTHMREGQEEQERVLQGLILNRMTVSGAQGLAGDQVVHPFTTTPCTSELRPHGVQS